MSRLLFPLVALSGALAAVVVLLALGLVAGEDAAEFPVAADASEVAVLAAAAGPVEVHRSASCGCCGGHLEHLADAGFEVVDHVHDDEDAVPQMKEGLGIPTDLWSCHTTLVGGYAVEGHVPAEVITALLDEGPTVDGIALPGMPAGSPGMAGQQDETWSFVSFTDGAADGVLTER